MTISPAAKAREAKMKRISAAAEAEAKSAATRAKASRKDSQRVQAVAPSFPELTRKDRPHQVTHAGRIKQRKLAAQAITRAGAEGHAPERPETGAEATEYELLLAALGEDMAKLKSIQSTEGKIAAKRELIEAYTPHVDGTLDAAAETGKAVQDEILVTMMLWRFDIADFARGLDLAEHVLRYGLRLPERFQRTPATLIVEEIAEAALSSIGQDRDFDARILMRVAQLTENQDMPDIVRAKLHKATGLLFVRVADRFEAEPDTAPAGAVWHARKSALENLRRAIELEPKIGVKKEIERLTGWLAKHAPANSDDDAGGDNTPADQQD